MFDKDLWSKNYKNQTFQTRTRSTFQRPNQEELLERRKGYFFSNYLEDLLYLNFPVSEELLYILIQPSVNIHLRARYHKDRRANNSLTNKGFALRSRHSIV